MSYPVMYLVRDMKNETLFKAKDKEQALNEGKRLFEGRTKQQNKDNPLCLVQSQFLGFIDELI